MIDNQKKSRIGNKVKKAYSTPRLTRLGAITELTSGGAGSKSESKSDMPPVKFP